MHSEINPWVSVHNAPRAPFVGGIGTGWGRGNDRGTNWYEFIKPGAPEYNVSDIVGKGGALW